VKKDSLKLSLRRGGILGGEGGLAGAVFEERGRGNTWRGRRTRWNCL